MIVLSDKTTIYLARPCSGDRERCTARSICCTRVQEADTMNQRIRATEVIDFRIVDR